MSEKALTRLRRDRIGFIFQAYNLMPSLDVAQNIGLPARLAGTRVDRDVAGRGRPPRRPRGADATPARRSSPAVSSSASPSPERW